MSVAGGGCAAPVSDEVCEIELWATGARYDALNSKRDRSMDSGWAGMVSPVLLLAPVFPTEINGKQPWLREQRSIEDAQGSAQAAATGAMRCWERAVLGEGGVGRGRERAQIASKGRHDWSPGSAPLALVHIGHKGGELYWKRVDPSI